MRAPDEPADSTELATFVREALHSHVGQDPDEYELGRFSVELDGFAVSVLAIERDFPAIRYEHLVMDIATTGRPVALKFINALHGRTSTMGAHWWLGETGLWQVGVLWAKHFDAAIFLDQLWVFGQIAKDRTPEIRARLGGGWPSSGS